MVSEGKNIKNYSRYLWVFVIINFIIFIYIILEIEINIENYSNLISGRGLLASSIALITFVLNGVITSRYKAILVFWRKENIYPGCRVFTDLINEDDRIDKSALKEKYGEIPKKPAMQNKLWYRIFKNHEFNTMVFHSHRNFLISRDLTGLSFLFLIMYGVVASISMYIFNVIIWRFSLYIVYLIIQYIVISKVSKHYGERFVCNVIAVECNYIQE